MAMRVGELVMSLTSCKAQESPGPHLGSRIEVALVVGVGGGGSWEQGWECGVVLVSQV